MYNNVETASVRNDQQVELANLMVRINNSNEQLEKLTYSIKEKLQSIHYQGEEKGIVGDKQLENTPQDNCFTAAMHMQLYKLEQSINRLHTIYQHLNAIV